MSLRKALIVGLSVALLVGTPIMLFGWAPVVGKLETVFAKPGGEAKSDKKGANAPTGRGERGRGGPVAVETTTARPAKVSTDIQAVGSLQSDESVLVAPEIPGRITEIPLEEGKPVKSGDVMVKLDNALARAEVTDAKARLELAAANNERANALVKSGAVTGRGRDEAVAAFETAQAALELAQTRLSKLELRAPFDGVAGLRSASVGAFITAGTPIANLEKIDVLKVDFKVPEVHLQSIRTGQKIDIRVDAVPERNFEGTIYAINPQVDVNGRALQVRAKLENKDMALRPGLFARIVIRGLAERDVVKIPESAVLPRSGENLIFVVENGIARQLKVDLGHRGDGEVEILKGVSAHAIVVVAGQQKLREGSQVEIIASEPEKSGDSVPKASSIETGSSG